MPKRDNHCVDETSHPETCLEHSGVVTLQKVTVGLAACAVGLLSYSVFWQAPSIKDEIKNEARIREDADKEIRRDLTDVQKKIACLEGKK